MCAPGIFWVWRSEESFPLLRRPQSNPGRPVRRQAPCRLSHLAEFKITLLSPISRPGYYLGYFRALRTDFALSFIFQLKSHVIIFLVMKCYIVKNLFNYKSDCYKKAGTHYLTMDAQWQREMTSVISANECQCIPYSCTVRSSDFNMYRRFVCLQHCQVSRTNSEILN